MKEIILLVPTYTYQAYNEHGGDSFYKGNQYERNKKISVSMNRPLNDLSAFHMPKSMTAWVSLLDSEKYDFGVIDMEYGQES